MAKDFECDAGQVRENLLNDYLRQVVWGRYKTVRIAVRNARTRITAPIHANRKQIVQFIADKLDWILKKEKEQMLRRATRGSGYSSDIRDSGFVYLLGKVQTIVADKNATKTHWDRENQRLVVAVDHNSSDEMRQSVVVFLLSQFEKLLSCRFDAIAERMALYPHSVKASNALTRWGSCNSRGNIRLSWRLVCLPLEYFDYVAVHELAHLVHMNHSKHFWKVVEEHCPNYAQIRKELKSIHIADLI